ITHAVNAPTLIQQQHSADALEGLQALAEQAGLLDNAIEEQVQSVSALEQNQQPQTLIIDQSGSADTTTTTEGVVEIVSGSAHLQELQEGVIESVHGEREAVKVENTHDEVVAGMELSEDQLSSLRHGDMVEMDGELYVVEMANDPDQPNKQILSFVPVSTTVIADQ
ncbi:transcriptional repressor ctcf, partial [Plakobranchus ocellatus]